LHLILHIDDKFDKKTGFPDLSPAIQNTKKRMAHPCTGCGALESAMLQELLPVVCLGAPNVIAPNAIHESFDFLHGSPSH